MGSTVDEALDDVPACWAWEPRPVVELLATGRRRRTDSDDLEALYVWQADRCALCGVFNDGCGRGGLYHDHDYRTGLLRGMLCPGCNTAEGNSDSPRICRYRLRHPTVLLGLEVEWSTPWHWLAPYEPDGSRAVERRSLGLAAGLPFTRVRR